MHEHEAATETVSTGTPITLTAKAVEAVRKAMQRESATGRALRVGVVGGGCSGFSYAMSFEDGPKDDDTVLEFDGITVLVDAPSREFLDGTVLDYVTGLHGSGFKFENPKASRSCGCGSSFSA
jgi:iron-sulfur cluster assembly accessory protein